MAYGDVWMPVPTRAFPACRCVLSLEPSGAAQGRQARTHLSQTSLFLLPSVAAAGAAVTAGNERCRRVCGVFRHGPGPCGSLSERSLSSVLYAQRRPTIPRVERATPTRPFAVAVEAEAEFGPDLVR